MDFAARLKHTKQQAIELLDAVDHPAVQPMLDTFHMHMEEASIAEAIQLGETRVVHFRANENYYGFPDTGASAQFIKSHILLTEYRRYP
ncbi:TIM barrel protein [Pseudorhizobium flavum]|uniref:Sugar phosphate isomerase/epimerase n=1 Tax=Pseudorhizobium flavum TaxID=1335061 RepID=A0A7W9YY48_9HYPH|nr:TIM barrel protein [Pseudorhizobium flavum]MBB6180552.1 sugar phosphate isomerase/epimerase [Pseudorhizobium flavum]